MFEGLKKKLRTPQFTAVSIYPDGIKEKVYLKAKNSGELLDVSLVHSPFCLEPLIVGVKTEQGLIKNEKEFELIFSTGEKKGEINIETIESNMAVKIFVSLHELLKLDDEYILMLLKVVKTNLFQLNARERKQLTYAMYFHYLKKRNRHTINFLNNMCAVYSYPRKVVLTTVKTKTHFNIFPMDFVLRLPEEKFLLLGLNENNRSIKEIFEYKKMIITDVPSSKKLLVYGLADQHRKDVKDIKNLPFDFFNSELFNHPVPEFALGYKEIELTKFVKMGSHYLLVCKLLNEKELKPQEPFLYHVHSIHQLHLRKNNLAYPVV
jgi:flavin reductase (DIM6/NTAB) family NADH-FMN oxidoreductase RutF